MITHLTPTSSSCTFSTNLPYPRISRALYDQLVLTAQEEDDRDVRPFFPGETGWVTVCFERRDREDEERLWETSGAGSSKDAGRSTRSGERWVEWVWVDEAWEALPNTHLRLPSLPSCWSTTTKHTSHPSSSSTRNEQAIPIDITLVEPVELERVVLRPLRRPTGEDGRGEEDEVDLYGIIERIQGPPDTDSLEDALSGPTLLSKSSASSSLQPPSPIFRQQTHYADPFTNREFEVLLTSPVRQGIVVRGRTEVVLLPALPGNSIAAISDEGRDARGHDLPGRAVPGDNDARRGITGSIPNSSRSASVPRGAFSDSGSISGSSRGRYTTREGFDPDVFLASASMLRERVEEDEDEENDSDEDELDGEVDERVGMDDEGEEDDENAGRTPTSALSLSSGSLTPRPFGSPLLVRKESFSSTLSTDLHPDDPDIGPKEDGPGAVNTNGPGLRKESPKVEFRGAAFEGVLLVRPPQDRRTPGKAERDTDGVMATGMKGEEWPDGDSKCWLTMDGLARAGIFVGDWVVLRLSGGSSEAQARLVQVDVLKVQFDEVDDLPEHPIFLSPMLRHRLCGTSARPSDLVRPTIMLLPIPSGHRTPSLPIAKYITLSRIATPWSVDKRYEERFNRGLRRHFEQEEKGVGKRLIKQGDIVAVPIFEQVDEADDRIPSAIAVVYFAVSYMSYDPLLPLEEDFVMSASSQARAGEFGCWVDVEKTRMMTISVQHGKSIPGMQSWLSIPREPRIFSESLGMRLSNFVSAHLSSSTLGSFNIPLLLTGARGSGKSSSIRRVAEDLAVHVVEVNCFDILDEAPATTEGTLLARLEKAQDCAPCVLLLRHVEALGRKSSGLRRGKDSPILVKLVAAMQNKSSAPGLPTILIGTSTEPDQISEDHMAVFKQELKLDAPSEPERLLILQERIHGMDLAIDVDLKRIARETAALTAVDLTNLVDSAQMASTRRLSDLKERAASAMHIGMPVNNSDFENALNKARSSLADAIGAPKIPNVSWDDVGGLADVKSDILDTIQLPLERPELFAEGLKKRSGILLYGPPGTGKTLLAKAVATSCSLNFFSVKGPELLNMYIGESEANVRRVFQKARDAQPCVIFMDELDSIAPKRGNQGDSGGVMDRIVSQLLAELDGMAEGKGGAGVFVMAATNRPDLLDPALLRPGRFDRMLYLSVSTDHKTQYNILSALTRKFNLDPHLDLMSVAEKCPFNYTGADFYALCSDAMLKAMSRTASAVDERIAALEMVPEPRAYPKPLTPQYYLSAMATAEETDVVVTEKDFVSALSELVPSVSLDDIRHYETVRRKFASETLNSEKQDDHVNGDDKGHVISKSKGKGKARA